jgi:hypothetical protein
MSHDSPRLSSSAEHEERASDSLGRFDVVRVRRAVPEHGLAGGEEGTIVDVLDDPERAYLVDFSGSTADPAAPDLPLATLAADQITLVSKFRPSR